MFQLTIYADDTVLMAHVSQLQCMLLLCETVANKCDITLHSSKTDFTYALSLSILLHINYAMFS